MSKKPNIDELLNDLTFHTTYNRIKNLAFNVFEWSGLPKGFKPEYIEKVLYERGKAMFFNDENYGLMCLQAHESGGQNAYGEFVKYRPYGVNYENSREYDLDECVIIKNNMLSIPTHDYIMIYANKVTEIERSMDVNVKAQKTPRIIACDDKDLLTFKNIFKQVDGNCPAIYADKNLNINSLEVLDITAPYVCDKLADLRHDVWNEIHTFLGINNANTDKRERLVTDEVNANNEAVEHNALYMLETRKRACKEINEMFGLNISVEFRRCEDWQSTQSKSET